MMLILLPKHSGDKNGNKPCMTDRSTQDIESGERKRNTEQSSGTEL